MEKPDGLIVMRPSELPDKLFSVSFDNIPGIGIKTQAKLAKYSINTTEDLYSYDAKYLRKAFGSIAGERLWYLLRGIELPLPKTEQASSKVLAPEFRDKNIAGVILHQLLMKAASRLRLERLYATRLDIELITTHNKSIKHYSKFMKANDSITLNLPYGKVPYISINLQNSGEFRLSFLVLIIIQLRVVFLMNTMMIISKNKIKDKDYQRL